MHPMAARSRPFLHHIFSYTCLGLCVMACAHVPKDRYGVRSVKLQGVEALDDAALLNCLSIEARPRTAITLGIQEAGACGEPPFDGGRIHIPLWSWFWTDWPLFDRIALERDLARIERWYAARGYHHARVRAHHVKPEQALEDDTLPSDDSVTHCKRRTSQQGCLVDVVITVEEGEPTLVHTLSIVAVDADGETLASELLPEALHNKAEAAVTLQVGNPFDESRFDKSQEALEALMAEAGYAHARVESEARVDPERREARVEFRITPGPAGRFGEVRVHGAGELPEAPIRNATLIQAGDPYRESTVAEAQRAVFGLGAFSAVHIDTTPQEDSSDVDLDIHLTPARRSRLGLGAGIQAGIITGGDSFEQFSVPQWDLHLVGRYTRRNFLGGLRQLKLEERPRLIMQQPFPELDRPRFGNVLTAQLIQPGFLEARTRLVLSSRYDFGPDPFDTFFRHRIDTGATLERYFLFRDKLFASLGLHNSLYFVPSGEITREGEAAPSDSHLTYFEQRLRLDLRNDRVRPTGGALLQLGVHEAGYLLPSSWDYLRFTPDMRLYIPLPWRWSIALRFAMGALFITHADERLDEYSQALGPRDFRLRGGGASSNRGFLPGELGDGPEGGVRRWEASAELRVAVTQNFGVVGFVDAGDVNQAPRFRFDVPQTAAGFGLRYFTLLGPLRFDIAWRIPSLQTLGDAEAPRYNPRGSSLFGQLDGAVHLTIGESF